MWQYPLKIFFSAIILVAVTELAKRSSFWGATLASLPLTSLLAFVWLYLDSGKTESVALLSQSIFWLVLPSLLLFITFPFLLRVGLNFWLSLIISCSVTALAYLGMIRLLTYLDIHI